MIEEEEPEAGEWCENCKCYLLFDFKKNEKNCLNCHASILIGDEEKNVNFENKNKQLRNVFNGLCFRTLNDEIVAAARAFLDYKFEIAKRGLNRKGELGGANGKWRKWTDEKTNTHKCKWAAEFCKTKLRFYNMSLEIELLNRVYEKPFLTKEQLIKIDMLFNDYIKFLHRKELNIRLNYKLFLSHAVKLFKYESLVLCAPIQNKERMTLLTDLWEEFLSSRFLGEADECEKIEKVYNKLLTAFPQSSNEHKTCYCVALHREIYFL